MVLDSKLLVKTVIIALLYWYKTPTGVGRHFMQFRFLLPSLEVSKDPTITPVLECKFLHPTPSQAKQTEVSGLEQRKVFCRAKGGEWMVHSQKYPESLNSFWGEIFIDKIWGEGCRMCTFLLIGWLWNNGGVPEILCSAWGYHPPPGWGALVPSELKRYCYVYLMKD